MRGEKKEKRKKGAEHRAFKGPGGDRTSNRKADWLNPLLILKGRMLMRAAGEFLGYSGAKSTHKTNRLGKEIF